MNKSEKGKELFKEFPPVSTEMWEAQINADLKGADYEKRLIWKASDGLKVKPYYRSEDIKNLRFTESLPGEYPFVRGTNSDNNNWEIRQDIESADIALSNKIALEAIERGADGVGFRVKGVGSADDLTNLIRYIELEKTAVHFISAREYPYIMELFIQEMKLRTANKNKVRGSLGFDPFNYYLLYNDFYNSCDDNMNEAVYLITKIRQELPGFRMINISADTFHNAGATVAQELAFAMASGNEYLSKLTDKGLSVDQIAPAMQFTFAIGSNYFLEIAKIRAARLLWSAIVGEYKPANPSTAAMFIHGTTSLWNKSVYDPYVNMLRTTTELMAGAIAGCNSISASPFDIAYKNPDNFSRRMARNTQIILKEESYFNKIADPAAGSYYIESLTDMIATRAWDIFREIESEGGFLEAIGKGIIRKSIEETAAKRDEDIARRTTVILGTNQYPNSNEKMLEKITEEPVKHYPGLNLYRGSGAFEELRLSTEKHVAAGNKRPGVFLLNIGNLTLRKARAAFASNFFGCAGYEMIDNMGFEIVEEGIKAAVDSGAEIVVICSSDEEYATLGVAAAEKLKAVNKNTIVVIAGNPTEIIDALKTAGVDEFIHMRTNALLSLRGFNQKLGIS